MENETDKQKSGKHYYPDQKYLPTETDIFYKF